MQCFFFIKLFHQKGYSKLRPQLFSPNAIVAWPLECACKTRRAHDSGGHTVSRDHSLAAHLGGQDRVLKVLGSGSRILSFVVSE